MDARRPLDALSEEQTEILINFQVRILPVNHAQLQINLGIDFPPNSSLSSLQNLSGLDDINQCRRILEHNGWDEQVCNVFFDVF